MYKIHKTRKNSSIALLGVKNCFCPCAIVPLVFYLGDGAALDEGGLVRGLGGWNERRRRGNVGRSTGSAERHTDSIWHALDQLVLGRMEDWWKEKRKKHRQLITRTIFMD